MSNLHLGPLIKLVCPLDDKLLYEQNNQLCCENGHSFDIARQGYVNLLPVQQKKSKEPGDSTEMVAARYRFLEAGYYDPVANKLNEIICALSAVREQIAIMDAGCGEGFYLERCLQKLESKYPDKEIACLGMDIAKPAIISAAKRSRIITWVVGTNKHPPIQHNTFDIVVCMFGFYDLNVFAQILRPGGHVVLVDPGPEHLLELRQVIYPYIKPPTIRDDSADMTLLDESTLKYEISLSKERIADLLIMTPHLYRAPRIGKEAAFRLSKIDLSVDVIFRILQL